MDIVYAAEKSSIAKVLSRHVKREIRPGDIQVDANPDETGSFFIRWRFDSYVMSPNGEVAANDPDAIARTGATGPGHCAIKRAE